MKAFTHPGAPTAYFSGTQDHRSWLRRTPEMILGPFYPADRVAPVTRDLTIGGNEGTSPAGNLILVNVGILDQAGHALEGVLAEFWQANAGGRYRHVLDEGPTPVDPCFDGFGAQTTDELGQLSFRTVRPGAYLTPLGDVRAPHIHFQVTAGALRLVTQMFFPDELLNGGDRFLKTCPNPAMLVARAIDSVDATVAEFSWQIVLARRTTVPTSSRTLNESQNK